MMSIPSCDLTGHRCAARRPRLAYSRQGQTMIYLVSVLALLSLVALWLADYGAAASSRIRAQNAADGSALAAAQWQARSLNAVGEINLVKAINTLLDNVPPGSELQDALKATTDPGASYAIIQSALSSLQSRIEFVGPMLAMVAAQQAAKNNGVPTNKIYTQQVRDHAAEVSSLYAGNFNASHWGAGTWTDTYANMLNYIADEGVAAAADNARYYNANLSASGQAQRYLLQKGFYRAIAIQDWCYLEDILMSGYVDYTYWGDITPLGQLENGSELFGLGLNFTSSDSLVGAGGLANAQFDKLRTYFTQEMTSRGLPLHSDWPQFVPAIEWATFDPSFWGGWTKAGSYRNALVAEVRPEYDTSGCDAVTAVSIRNGINLGLTNRSSGWTSWIVGSASQTDVATSVTRLENLDSSSDLDVKANAAAKPFGKLPNVSDPVHSFAIVLPVFQDMRLIPIALATSFGTADPLWMEHKTKHLAYNDAGDTVSYTHFGPDSIPTDCFYCQQLVRWEDASFRQQGIDWLVEIDPVTNAKKNACFIHSGSPTPTQGVPYAH